MRHQSSLLAGVSLENPRSSHVVISSELSKRLMKERVNSVPHWLCSHPCPSLFLYHQVCKCGRRAGWRKVSCLPSLCCGRKHILRDTFSGHCHLHHCSSCPTTSLPVFVTVINDLTCLLSFFTLSGPFPSQALGPHPSGSLFSSTT